MGGGAAGGTRVLLQGSSAPWLCCSLCLQAGTDTEAAQAHQGWLIRTGPRLCSGCLASSRLPEPRSSQSWRFRSRHRSQEQKVKVPPLHCDSRVKTISADVMTLPSHQLRALSPQQKGFSVILSDMCPLVSGITTKDAALSVELGMRALDLAVGRRAAFSVYADGDDNQEGEQSHDAETGVLQVGGNLLIKLLESEDAKEISQISKPLFRKSSWLRPKATRPSSREIYLICLGLKPEAEK